MACVKTIAVLLLLLSVACGPGASLRDAGSKNPDTALPFDAAVADNHGRDMRSARDIVGLDMRPQDQRFSPSDSSFIRDTIGSDLVVGPLPDAASRDSAIPPPGTQQCQNWQDCAPHYADSNSGYDCVNQVCTCDPSGQMLNNCMSLNGLWIGQECFCVIGATSQPPAQDAGMGPGPDEYCWWSWQQDPCDPDYWVDTSYQVEECYCCDSYGDDICEWVWEYDGHWEDGDCPAGYWESVCY